jgi:hypothetical protein
MRADYEIPPRGKGDITDKNLCRLMRRIEAISAAYRHFRDVYRGFGLRPPMWEFFSCGSLAKAIFDQMKVNPFRRQNPGFPPEV